MDFAFPDLTKAVKTSAPAAVDHADDPAPTPRRIPLGLLATVTHAVVPKIADSASDVTSSLSSKQAGGEKSGKSQVDYMRHLSSEDTGPSQPLRRDIPLSELKQHSTAGDAWMAIKGKVYDISSYMTVRKQRGRSP